MRLVDRADEIPTFKREAFEPFPADKMAEMIDELRVGAALVVSITDTGHGHIHALRCLLKSRVARMEDRLGKKFDVRRVSPTEMAIERIE